MSPSLQAETEKLTRSWMRHDAQTLREYLVADVEDPRINLQSIFTRHFLAWNLFGPELEPLMKEEYRFSAAFNSLLRLAVNLGDAGERDAVLHALEHHSDNAEGMEIPAHILQTFATLPATTGFGTIPNYVRGFLEEWTAENPVPSATINSFLKLWSERLNSAANPPAKPSPRRPSVLEPACGSANDYRFLNAYGFGFRIDYSGFDLCPKNVENARRLFPDARFFEGNVFQIDAEDRAYDLCFVHDLLEHLSAEGLEVAVRELCRVTRTAMCVHFFSMDETREHVIRPVDDYHWNLLSMARTRAAFETCGFDAQVFHAATFLQRSTGATDYHNPTAYTFLLRRRSSMAAG